MEAKVNTIAHLKAKGYSKYRIAKECHVSWNTVHMWDRGIFTPSVKNQEKLRLLWEKNGR